MQRKPSFNAEPWDTTMTKRTARTTRGVIFGAPLLAAI